MTETESKELIQLLMNYTPEHEQRVRELVARCPDPDLNSYVKNGLPLFYDIAGHARKPGYENLLQFLLDVGYKASGRGNLLHYAVFFSMYCSTERAVKIILDSPGHYIHKKNECGSHAIRSCVGGIAVFCSSNRTLSILLAYGAKDNRSGNNPFTCLHNAQRYITNMSLKYVTEKLLESGSSVTTRSSFGDSPIYIFVRMLEGERIRGYGSGFRGYINIFIECTLVLTMMITNIF